MKFLIKEISTSRKEVRIQIVPFKSIKTEYYQFGQSDGNFDEGAIDSQSVPFDLAKFTSIGPNPAHVRLLVAYLKDTLTIPSGFANTLLVTKNNQYIPIVNIVVDDISLYKLTSETIPTFIVKLLNPLPSAESLLDEIKIEKQVLSTQEQEVYYISAEEPPSIIRSLDYDEGMIDEIGNPELRKIEFNNYNQLTASFKQTEKSNLDASLSSSLNIKLDYNDFSGHVHFGSAVSKLENFKQKVKNIEDHLVIISQSLATSSLASVNDVRQNKFNEINKIKASFTDFEKHMYYKSDTLNYKYNVNLGANYAKSQPVSKTHSKTLLNTFGFNYVTHISSSKGNMNVFNDLYEVEDKPFYNWSGSFYLSFLMKGDESIKNSNINNIKWTNAQQNHIPKLPHDTLYTSSILEPNIKSGSWQRYIYEASASYWAPHSSNPIIGYPGTITNFGPGSTEVTPIHNSIKTGSYSIKAGGRYTNLATYVTSSGVTFSGSISPAGDLFHIKFNSISSSLTSSYITDVKINRYNPINSLPFSEVYRTGSTEFTNWYDDMYASASAFDNENPHSFIKTVPAYLHDDNQMNNADFRKFVNMMGEQYDITKNYIDGYTSIYKNQYGEVGAVPDNLLPVLSKNYNWDFNLPIGKKEDADYQNFFGSSLSDINATSNDVNNIWRNVINNIRYIYKTKGTQNSVRALLNSYGFPPDILKIREHGASLDNHEDTVLTDDNTNLSGGVGESTGNMSFRSKEDKLVSYVMDSKDRIIHADWGNHASFPSAIEFVMKPDKGTVGNTILMSSGSAERILWDLKLEPSASSDTKARLKLRLNRVSNNANQHTNFRVSMSTAYHDFKNGNQWNVLVQQTNPAIADVRSSREQDYPYGASTLTMSMQIMVGEQDGDKIKTFDITDSPAWHNTTAQGVWHRRIQAAWYGTGSRTAGTTGNLIIGGPYDMAARNQGLSGSYTGSLSEIRTWKYPISASKFKQHILDKRSVVGNSLLDSQTNLVYHFRLNENYISGSKNLKIQDANPNNVKDFSIPFSDVMTGSLIDRPLYDSETFDRIQFNVGIGGSHELSDNNVIVDQERRFINQLNPEEPSVMNVYHPLINKRKASSTLELTRSPQEVINDFILNQLGNFDFNDKFADPQDINKPSYKDLEKFSEDFFNYYDISLDINKFIRAQVAIFNKDLIKSLKKVIPVRAGFSKVGVEIKPTFLERQKIQNNKLEQEMLNFEGSIKYAKTNTDISDFKNNTFLGKTLEKNIPVNLSKNVDIQYSNVSGSEYYGFTTLFNPTKNGHIEYDSATGSKYFTYGSELRLSTDVNIQYSNVSGSEYYGFQNIFNPSKDGHIEIQSSTGSNYYSFTKLESLYKTNDVSFPIDKSGFDGMNMINQYTVVNTKDSRIDISSESTGSFYKFDALEPLYTTNDINFSVASTTGSLTYKFDKFLPIYKVHKSHFSVASSTGSIAWDFDKLQPLYSTKDYVFDVASSTGSITWDFDKLQPLYETHKIPFSIASTTGSLSYKFDDFYPLYQTRDKHFSVASSTGSIAWDFTILEPLHKTHNVPFSIASPTGSLSYRFDKLKPLYSTKDYTLNVASSTGSISYDFTKLESLYTTKNINFSVSSPTGSVTYNFTKKLPNFETKDTSISIASSTGSVSYNWSKLEPIYSSNNGDVDISVTHKTGSKSLSLTNDYYKYKNGAIEISSATGSNPTIETTLRVPHEAFVKFKGDKVFYDEVNESFIETENKWGTGINDTHFIHFGNPGKNGDFNTYHYENRYLYYALGDVESVSGSIDKNSSEVSFDTDFTGTITAGVFTASKDFSNQTLVKTNEILGLRPLGTTIEFKASSAVSYGGKFLDEQFVYPPNHIFVVGSTKDSISRLVYQGTQNSGGDVIESEAFTDLSEDAFYHILTTGGQGYTVQSEY